MSEGKDSTSVCGLAPFHDRLALELADYPDLDDQVIFASDALDQEDRARRRLAEAERTSKGALQQLCNVIRLREPLLDEHEKQGLFSDVYWSDPKFAGPVEEGCVGIFIPSPMPFTFACRKCGDEYHGLAYSWSQIKAPGSDMFCEQCGQFEEEAKRERLSQLRWMPYADYLKTDHWQSIRAETLDRCDNQCMVCNQDHGLDVHHRTYERRGRELPGDTIALCRWCHDLFHANGRLAPIGGGA
jgi:hypothetical protein